MHTLGGRRTLAKNLFLAIPCYMRTGGRGFHQVFAKRLKLEIELQRKPTADVVYPNCMRTSALILSMSSAAIDSATSCHVRREPSSSSATSESVPVPGAGSTTWSSGGGSMGIKIPRLCHVIGGGGGKAVSRPSGESGGTSAR